MATIRTVALRVWLPRSRTAKTLSMRSTELIEALEILQTYYKGHWIANDMKSQSMCASSHIIIQG